MRVAFFAFVVLCQSGCLSSVVPAHEPIVEESDLHVLLAERAYRGDGFVHVSRAPYDSTLEPGHQIDIYVSSAAAAAYLALSPGSTDAGAPFPVGGVIVRESLAEGKLVDLTVMHKREPGYFADVDDFFFGVTDGDANVATDGGGNPEWGPLGACATCHRARASAGCLFGVPPSAR